MAGHRLADAACRARVLPVRTHPLAGQDDLPHGGRADAPHLYTPPNATTMRLGWREGSLHAAQQGGITMLLRYIAGPQFAKLYGQTALAGLCPQLRFENATERSDFVAATDKLIPTVIPSASSGGGGASFTCRHGGQDMAVTVDAVTRIDRNSILWNVIFLRAFITPKSQSEAAQEVLQHMTQSYRYDPAWVNMQQGNRAGWRRSSRLPRACRRLSGSKSAGRHQEPVNATGRELHVHRRHRLRATAPIATMRPVIPTSSPTPNPGNILRQHDEPHHLDTRRQPAGLGAGRPEDDPHRLSGARALTPTQAAASAILRRPYLLFKAVITGSGLTPPWYRDRTSPGRATPRCCMS